MNKKILLSLAVSASFLFGFGFGSKDADYYFEHPVEIKSTIKECKHKIKEAMQKTGIDFLNPPKIETEEALNDFEKKMEQLILDMEEIKDNKECQSATVAAAAVHSNNLKKAKMEYSDSWESDLSSFINDFKLGLKEEKDKFKKLQESKKEENK